ncbi:hypothetical protein OF83DRAFT_1067511 [Amylostereum chailletii]|nr:hypothetical protein OF83DRAFT_1067511 [Amylostereum chailletii]
MIIFSDELPLSESFKDCADFLLHMDLCDLCTDDSGNIADSEFADVLLSDKFKPVANFFDRNPRMVNWYYTLYALDAHAGTSPAKNTVASSVVEGPAAKITGPAIVVKNGPMDNWASIDTVISEVDLAQTLWWYYKSGVSVQEVFGERMIIRLYGK